MLSISIEIFLKCCQFQLKYFPALLYVTICSSTGITDTLQTCDGDINGGQTLLQVLCWTESVCFCYFCSVCYWPHVGW